MWILLLIIIPITVSVKGKAKISAATEGINRVKKINMLFAQIKKYKTKPKHAKGTP